MLTKQKWSVKRKPEKFGKNGRFLLEFAEKLQTVIPSSASLLHAQEIF